MFWVNKPLHFLIPHSRAKSFYYWVFKYSTELDGKDSYHFYWFYCYFRKTIHMYNWGHISRVSRKGNGTPLQYSCLENSMDGGAWWAAVYGVAKSRTRLSNFTFTVHFHALEKEMATHSSVPAWRIPGTGEPGGLPSLGPHRVGHNWSDLAAAASRVSSGIRRPRGNRFLRCCDFLTSQWVCCLLILFFHHSESFRGYPIKNSVSNNGWLQMIVLVYHKAKKTIAKSAFFFCNETWSKCVLD